VRKKFNYKKKKERRPMSAQERALLLQDGFQRVVQQNFPKPTETDMGAAVQALSMTAVGLSIQLGIGEAEFVAAMTTYFRQAHGMMQAALAKGGPDN